MISEELPFRYRDERGEWHDWTGFVYRPEGDGHYPLVYYAGYEVQAEQAAGFVAAGVVVITPKMVTDETHWPNPNPVGRGIKLDEALLRRARVLPYVDDRKVIISGGSAGGYMTMMTSAATFPLAGSFPVVPPINLNYTQSVWSYNVDEIRSLREDGVTNVMRHPGSDGISGLWIAVTEWHGTGGEELWQWSPLAHLEQITSPVVIIATSADALVPIGQFGGPEEFLRKAYATATPIYPIDPAVVGRGDAYERHTLLDMLPAEETEVHVLDVPDDWHRLIDLENAPPYLTLDVPLRQRRWMVILLDEGGPEPDVGHFKYAVTVNVIPLLLQVLQETISVDQLTLPKLSVLADRWLGRNWIEAKGERDLTPDELAEERADVRRGLGLYAATSPEHAERLTRVAAELDAERASAIADVLAEQPAR